MQVCEETLARLELALSQLTEDLIPKYEKLVSILRTAAGANTRSKVSFAEVDITDMTEA